MSTAVCWKCGAFKLGAFGFCKECGAIPGSDEDLAISLALTNQLISEDDLKKIAMEIKKGNPFMLNEEVKQKLIENMRASGIHKMIVTDQDHPDQEHRVPSKRPWWKFWR